MDTSNKHHANRPSALTAADRARLAAHISGKPSKDAFIFALLFKLSAVVLVAGFVAGCV